MKIKIKFLFFLSILLTIFSLFAARYKFSHSVFPDLTNTDYKEREKNTLLDTVVQEFEEVDSISEDDLNKNDSIFALEDTLNVEEIIDTLTQKENDETETIAETDSVEIPFVIESKHRFNIPLSNHPLTKNMSQPFTPAKGLQNRHIALWQSHGLYYKQSKEKWMWQRANIFGTREDLFTQSFVLPFLVPMLENAGAAVLLPRERDTQLTEIIVDNDNSSNNSDFVLHSGRQKWEKGFLNGFANIKDVYLDGENPFIYGSYVQVQTTDDKESISTAEWLPHFPQKDKYALYISYKTLYNSSQNATYTVYHTGGATEFQVNQTMGGGTWIYLGTFTFDKGKNQNGRVVLSNLCSETDKIITADAIKIGGGMGNISRKRSDLVTKKVIKTPIKGKKYVYKYVKKRGKRVRVPVRRYKTKVTTSTQQFHNYSTSEMPRFVEGSRYWLQWAGVPDTVYSRTKSQDDYSDDFQSRGFWVNYLSGGSPSNPTSAGLSIPIDAALAFHTDAGRTSDSIIGTLAIHTAKNTQGKYFYNNGTSRWTGRDLTDKIQTQIVNDIREKYDTRWVRRQLWNRSYSESRVPEVPTILLELLSHQNFPDMRFGLDPRFRFDASRAIYKGMLRFISEQNNSDCIIQPLPVEAFSVQFKDSATVRLHWEPVEDPLEKTATPTGYIVYTRIGQGGFDNGEFSPENTFDKKIGKNKIYSFKVEAVNDGGKSFPSEILSACKTNSDTILLIVNAFNRVSAPASFSTPATSGFNSHWDAGVPYINDYKTTGEQVEFRKGLLYLSDENPGHGRSNTNLEGKVIAGNTFDYPLIHGISIKKGGYSFVSCSEKSIEQGGVRMSQYAAVDIILGKERQWTSLDKKTDEKVFKTFTPEMRKAIIQYANNSGNLFISGAHVVSDLSMPEQSTPAEYGFLVNLMKAKWAGYKVNGLGEVKIKDTRYFKDQTINFYNEPNSELYFVEAPDALEPTDEKAIPIGKYSGSELYSGVLYNGTYNICTFGFPFETIKGEKERDDLMRNVLHFLFEEGGRQAKKNKKSKN
ncbi:MAG: xanthan lyase [Paludibacteraceae bacterium]